MADWYGKTILHSLWAIPPERFTSQAFWDAFEKILPEHLNPLATGDDDPLDRVQLHLLDLWKAKQMVSKRLLAYDTTNFYTYIASNNTRNELAQRGHSVDVIHCLDSYHALAAREPETSPIDHPNIKVHGLKSGVGFVSPLATQQTGRPLFKASRIRRILQKGFDVIHYHNISLIGGPKILQYGSGIKLYARAEAYVGQVIDPAHPDPEHHVPDVIERFNKYGFRGSKQVVQMIWAGAFDRFPKLNIYVAEVQIGWVPNWMDQMDNEYGRQQYWAERVLGLPRLKQMPSEIAREHCYWGFNRNPVGVRISRREMGVDNVMWASDFPHLESDWPNSRKVIAENFAGSTEEEMWKMTVGNAVKYFHLNDR